MKKAPGRSIRELLLVRAYQPSSAQDLAPGDRSHRAIPRGGPSKDGHRPSHDLPCVSWHPLGVKEARSSLDSAYGWLDGVMKERLWAGGAEFSMADCSAAPSLFYADWVHEIECRFANVRAYRARLLTRPSVARAVDEARPYRGFFPLGAPDRD